MVLLAATGLLPSSLVEGQANRVVKILARLDDSPVARELIFETGYGRAFLDAIGARTTDDLAHFLAQKQVRGLYDELDFRLGRAEQLIQHLRGIEEKKGFELKLPKDVTLTSRERTILEGLSWDLLRTRVQRPIGLVERGKTFPELDLGLYADPGRRWMFTAGFFEDMGGLEKYIHGHPMIQVRTGKKLPDDASKWVLIAASDVKRFTDDLHQCQRFRSKKEASEAAGLRGHLGFSLLSKTLVNTSTYTAKTWSSGNFQWEEITTDTLAALAWQAASQVLGKRKSPDSGWKVTYYKFTALEIGLRNLVVDVGVYKMDLVERAKAVVNGAEHGELNLPSWEKTLHRAGYNVAWNLGTSPKAPLILELLDGMMCRYKIGGTIQNWKNRVVYGGSRLAIDGVFSYVYYDLRIRTIGQEKK